MIEPACQCFRERRGESENVAYDLSIAVAKAIEENAPRWGLCQEAVPYVMLTVITMLARGIAGHEAGGDVRNCDGEFEALLLRLPEEVRIRDGILNALVERARQGGSVQ